MTHLFGYTFPEFSYDSSISENMKLDYFVMLKLEKEYRVLNETCIFFICVMNNNVAQNLITASAKYEHKGEIEMRFVQPDVSDFKVHMKMLYDDVKDYGTKLVIPEANTPEKRAKMNKFAHAVGRRCLRRAIKINYPKAKEFKDVYMQPSGLSWDYYGLMH